MRRLRDWLEETHSGGFELRRHFFRRFFDSDLVSTPGQWQVVAGGVLAALLSLSLIFAQAYYHKYVELDSLGSPEPLRRAVMADVLFLITLAMFQIGLFTTFQWPSLFPGLRDYLALASLPVRMRDVFAAKFTALVGFAALFIVAVTILPSLLLPAVVIGRHAPSTFRYIPSIFVSSFSAAAFVFFALVAAQGVLLNLLPVRFFLRVSLAIQGILLTLMLCGLLLVFSIPSLAPFMDQRPGWIAWIPAIWFFGIQQTMMGSPEPLAHSMALRALGAAAIAAMAAVLTYLWSYRRHRVRLLESSASPADSPRREFVETAAERLISNVREMAIFAFIGKTLARSRQHRLILTAFAALAVAAIFESFVSIVLSRGLGNFSNASVLRPVALSAPLALSMFVLAGFRYLFRLPVELRANWVFRINEAGNRRVFLDAVERFLLSWAVIPVALVTAPLEIAVLGFGLGVAATIFCLLLSLVLMEVLLIRFDKIPFTSAYLPGQRPVVETLVIYGVSVALYVSALSTLVSYCLRDPLSSLVLFVFLLAAWLSARRARLEDWKVGLLEFEELPEPAVRTLGIERD